MTNENKLYELMEKMYIEMQGMKNSIENLEAGQSSLENEVSSIKKIALKIEEVHDRKLDALFDGYKQNTEILNTIKEEVVKHEEIIIRRIK